MKFTCTKEHFLNALNKVGSVAGKNVNLPILNNLLIKVDNQKVELSATNLDIAVSAQLRSKIESEGSFTVPARTIIDFVSLVSDEKVDVELAGQELLIKSGKSTSKIKGFSAEEYPIIPSFEEGKLFITNTRTLKDGLTSVLSSVAKNDIRPELSGIYCGFNVKNKKGLVLASTDSFRLAETFLPLTQGEEELSVILPGRMAQELSRILSAHASVDESERVLILISDNQIRIDCGSTRLLSRLVEGTYPDYTQIIPQQFKTTALVSVQALVKEIKAAGLFTTMGVNAVKFVLKPSDESIHISSASTQSGEYVSELTGEIKGEENTIILSYRYILEGLNNISTDKVEIKMINGDSPCIITPEKDGNFLYIVMPIRQ
jgi:DNA polymerase-3 subunit beta